METLKEFRKANYLTQEELGVYLDMKKSFVSKIENGKEKLPQTKFLKLLNNDKGWDTSMLTSEKSDEAESVIIPTNKYMIPVLPVAARAGGLGDYIRGVRGDECELAISPIPGADMIIPVNGESMAPEYPNGSRVIVKQINEKAFIEWGKVYVLDTENGAVLKEIHKSDNENELICVSLNSDPKYAEFTVQKSDIRGIYRVLMVMALK